MDGKTKIMTKLIIISDRIKCNTMDVISPDFIPRQGEIVDVPWDDYTSVYYPSRVKEVQHQPDKNTIRLIVT